VLAIVKVVDGNNKILNGLWGPGIDAIPKKVGIWLYKFLDSRLCGNDNERMQMKPKILVILANLGGPDKVVLLPLYPQFSTITTKSSIEEWQKIAPK
jgi:hypothetical protein